MPRRLRFASCAQQHVNCRDHELGQTNPAFGGHHGLAPHVVIRASNGDLIVAGSNNELGYRPWATRISSTGGVRWEFVEGESDKML
jgi:hypothetical protein